VIRVGPAGWSYADWEGIVYPRRRRGGVHPLQWLAAFVDCVEIDSTFYAPARDENARRWVELVRDRPDFRFTAKLERVFTHEPLPADAAGERALGRAAERYLRGIEPLAAAGRLSALLVQHPLSFRHEPAALARLERNARVFGHLPLVLEVRHRSWFEPAPLAAIERLGYSLAAIDLPAARDHPPEDAEDACAVGPLGYLRLHGRNAEAWFDARAGRDRRYDYLYSPEQIRVLAERARRLATGRDETFVVTNNHFAGKAVANALELVAEIDGAPPAAPAMLVEAFPHLAAVTRATGQPSLFDSP
jgi:uncharacterized protein YecE (DUF72 family)